MAQEIDLGGTIYISSKRAAEITGYTQDYIGQLARAGHIAAQRVSGLWYVVEQSLLGYKAKADEFKPEPPKPVKNAPDLESIVSFDGRDYVSAQRAAKVTGYHQDYVGQLARSGKVVSRQIGNRWYVDREGLVEHKRHNDSLLAAVQADSVGLAKEADYPGAKTSEENALHFKYLGDSSREPLIPEIESWHEYNEQTNGISGIEVTNPIPIRVIRPQAERRTSRSSERLENSLHDYGKTRRLGIAFSLATIFLCVAGGAYAAITMNQSIIGVVGYTNDAVRSALPDALLEISATHSLEVPSFLRHLVSNELYYRRDSF